MRAAAIAAAVFVAFIGVMYVRFSGDAVPTSEPRPSPIVGADGSVCIVTRRADAPDPTPTPADGSERAPCATFRPGEEYSFLSASKATPVGQAAIPEILKGMKIVPLELGPPFDLPKDLALILETGCWGCSGGPSGLVRLYVRSDGSLSYEPLIDREELGIPPQLNTAPDGSVYEFRSPLTGYAIRPDGSRIVASLCSRDRCGKGGEDVQWSAESQTAIFSSSDGGITWTEIGRLEVGAEVLAILSDDRILLSTWDKELSFTFRTFPDLSVVEPPMPALYWNVEDVANGELVWWGNTGVPRRSDGEPILSLPEGNEGTRVDDVAVDSESMDGLALISGNETQPPYANYLVPFDRSGGIGRGEFARGGESVIWSSLLLRLGVESSHPPTPGVIFGNASVPTSEIAPGGYPIVTDYDPVVVDLNAGTIRVLTPFTGPDVPRSRNHVVAVQQGPFARVVNTDGTCLNIRAQVGGGAALDCAAEGVLLRTLGGEASLDGVHWLAVVTPAGVEGWASTQYLER